ncbi:DNA repair protein RecO [Patescibacteria group bacterium]|nr:DNA repair protein RecO [Patescibacteria group bacterium]
MATIKTKGIIIKRINLGEADRILTILTEDRGKIRVVAKGVRKPKAKLGGFLELFRYNEYLLAEGRNLDLVAGAYTINNLVGIGQSLRSVATAYYIAETVDKLIEETQEINRVFEIVYQSLESISVGWDLDAVKSWFEINLLTSLGFRPELNHCVECRTPVDEGWFSFDLGGMLDAQHRSSDPASIPIGGEELLALRAMSGDIPKQVLPKVAQISAGFMEQIIDRNLKSKEFLAEVTSGFLE